MSEQTNLSNHVVILGWDDFSRDIIAQLLAAQNTVALGTNRPEDEVEVERAFGEDRVHLGVGNFTNISSFDELEIGRCRKVFVNLETDHDNLIAVLAVRRLFPEVQIDVVIDNEELQDTFFVAGVTYAVSPHAIASRVVASHVYEEDVGRFTSEILSATEAQNDCEMQQYRVLEGHAYAGRPYDEVFWDLKERFDCALLGVSKTDADGARTLHKLPGPDVHVEAGDYLVLILRGDREQEVVEMFGVDEGVARQFDGDFKGK